MSGMTDAEAIVWLDRFQYLPADPVVIEQIRDHFAALIAERDALRVDAERYRAIRNPPNNNADAMCAWSTTHDGLISDTGNFDGPQTGSALDEILDSAIATTQEQRE